MSGKLFLVPTPIGNLEDMTFRSVRVLREVDLIAAEDTRNSLKLLRHFEIGTPMTSYHEFNKYDKAEELVEKMLDGREIACITDAGMPGISDPGEVLVQQCFAAGIPVEVLPGASAVVTAVAGSGISSRRFAFEAFLPKESKERKAVLEELSRETRTIVLYEAPHRLKKTLELLFEALGDRELCICRELSKMYEERDLTTLSGAIAKYEAEDPRGEFVLVIAGKSRQQAQAEQQAQYEDMSIPEHFARYLAQGMDRKVAMKAVAKDRGLPKREVYAAVVEEK